MEKQLQQNKVYSKKIPQSKFQQIKVQQKIIEQTKIYQTKVQQKKVNQVSVKLQMYRPLISIAPMIDVTYNHYRYFMRLLTKKSILYTQMIHHGAVLNNHSKILPFNKQQHPIVLQLGGCDPIQLAQAAIIGQKYGYDEINLNVGCPSPRVQDGKFGACLMREPHLVYQCMEQIAKKVNVPITVKCRLGIDDHDSYQFVKEFVRVVSGDQKGSVKHFLIHARKAFLKGLNPAQNRNIPPLQYEKVFQLRKDFPSLKFTINGGIKKLQTSKHMIQKEELYGVMMGRAAYEDIYEFINTDEYIFGQKTLSSQQKDRKYILYKYAEYVDRLMRNQIKDQNGNLLHASCAAQMVKPVLSLYQGERGCARFRQKLSDHTQIKHRYLPDVIREAADYMETMKVQSQELLKNKKQSELQQQIQTKLKKLSILQ